LRQAGVDGEVAGDIAIGGVDSLDRVLNVVLDVFGRRRTLEKQLIVLYVQVRQLDSFLLDDI
jgi:hypothetical protein